MVCFFLQTVSCPCLHADQRETCQFGLTPIWLTQKRYIGKICFMNKHMILSKFTKNVFLFLCLRLLAHAILKKWLLLCSLFNEINDLSRVLNSTAAAKLLQSCPTLCDPKDGSPPGSPVPGILQARTLEWVVISLSNAWKWKMKVKSLSRVRLLATPWTAAYQEPPSMGFSRQEYWSGVPLPSPRIPPCTRNGQQRAPQEQLLKAGQWKWS